MSRGAAHLRECSCDTESKSSSSMEPATVRPGGVSSSIILTRRGLSAAVMVMVSGLGFFPGMANPSKVGP